MSSLYISVHSHDVGSDDSNGIEHLWFENAIALLYERSDHCCHFHKMNISGDGRTANTFNIIQCTTLCSNA